MMPILGMPHYLVTR